MTSVHTFHIPVMGLGFSIDSPLRVSQFGIDSVISIVDDLLLERHRKHYCEKYDLHYEEISDKDEDYRAKRITSYLNLVQELAEKKFEELKNSATDVSNELKDYFNMLADGSTLKNEFKELTENHLTLEDIKNWLHENLSMGSIDVNIMSKLDKDNFIKGKQLPVEYNDAHAALRGFANSDLSSSIVLSAGMNNRLYSYLEKFEDFYPDVNNNLKKKIVLKVSDYRSAFIQGRFLAKKGIWVSEYRVESGLNCGGHAFATDGFLMGPILAEFRDNKESLIKQIYELYVKALTDKNRHVPAAPLPMRITAQGGVGTAEEHQFLLDHYKVDSVGWGSPFLLVPEATAVDENTLDQLIAAKEEDLYLSGISPLGVPFNSLRGNTKDIEKMAMVEKGKPGSPCPKKYVALNREYDDKILCTASRQYQHRKLKELDEANLSPEKHQTAFDNIVEKACICVGLGTSALMANDIDVKVEGTGVSICPGPNLAYFSRKMKLKEMVDHIYGRLNVITRTDRPNMFIKELSLYVNYLTKKINESEDTMTDKDEKYFDKFINNLKDGISYYDNMFSEVKGRFEETKSEIHSELDGYKSKLEVITTAIKNIRIPKTLVG